MDEVVVVAVLAAKPGCGPQVIESFREVSPLVHAEPGCELYAAHLDGTGDDDGTGGGDTVVMVERWTTRADLAAHAAGAAVERLNELNDGLLLAPADVTALRAVPLGDAAKGVIPRAPLG